MDKMKKDPLYHSFEIGKVYKVKDFDSIINVLKKERYFDKISDECIRYLKSISSKEVKIYHKYNKAFVVSYSKWALSYEFLIPENCGVLDDNDFEI